MANLKLGVTIGGNVAIHAGNYNNYAPTLTGGNASGTWSINITGNSATTSQTNFSSLTISGAAVATQAWVTSQGYITGVSDVWVNTSGDTMTGDLVIRNTGSYNNLRLLTNDDNSWVEQTKPDGTIVGRMGFDGYSTASAYYTDYALYTRGTGDSDIARRIYIDSSARLFLENLGGFTYNGYTVYHSGNFTDSSTNWNAAYNDRITAVAVSGGPTKTLTLTQQDGGTLTATWSDLDTDTDTNTYLTSASFNTTNGVLTLTRNDSVTVTVDLDGRFYTQSESDGRYVNVTGDVMTGALGISTGTAGIDSFYVDGTYGRLFTVTDDLSDAVFSVNTISGLPIIEAYSDYSVRMGRYGQNDFYVNPSGQVSIGGLANGSYKFTALGGQWGSYFKGGDLGTGSDVARFVKADNSVALHVRGDGRVGVGTSTLPYMLTVAGDIYANGGSVRISGNNVLYWETHNGGWSMTDSYWVRTYNNNGVYIGTGRFRTDLGDEGFQNFGSANWYMFDLGDRGASSGRYGIGLTADANNRTLSAHIPNHSAYSSSGNVPKFGWYSNGSDELMTLQSATGNLWVKGSISIAGNTAATQTWVQSQGYLTSVSDVWVNTSGDTMTGNLAFGATSNLGITWGLNTDAAFIKFISSGNQAGGSYLEIGTQDDLDEEIKFTQSGTVRFYLATDGFLKTGGGAKYVYESGTWGINVSGNSATTSQTEFGSLTVGGRAVATQDWVTSQGYITSYTETSTLAQVTSRGNVATGDIYVPTNAKFRARYDSTNNYHASLEWHGLQLGNNGPNYIIAGRTNAGGKLMFYTNNTSDFTSINGSYAATMHASGRTSFGTDADNGYQVQVYGSLYASDWVRVAGSSGLYFESYGGGWRMYDSTWIRAYNDKSIYTGGAIESGSWIGGNSSQTRDKFRVWSSSAYSIGMKSGYDYGHLGTDAYAMSFQMNNDSSRGFWWGDEAHSDDQGAASLTTEGRMTIARSLSIGEGESVTSPSSIPLYVKGSTNGADVFAVDGINGRLFTVNDDLSDSLFSVNTIAGLPLIEAFADNTIKIGKYGSNSITISNSKIAINSDTVDANFPFYVSDRSTAASRYILTNPGMGFNLADNYAQLQLYGPSGAYIDFVNSGGDYNGRIIWSSGAFAVTGNMSWGGATLSGAVWNGTAISDSYISSASNWNTAYNKRPTAVAFSGTSTKTLTLTLGDGSTLTAAFNDIDTDTNTDGQTLSISGSTLTISGGNSVTLPSGGISQATADGLYVSQTNNTSLNTDSRNTRGVTRLYRYDDNSDYSVQHYWTGSYWYLRGFSGDTYHAGVQVAYANDAGNADTTDGLHVHSGRNNEANKIVRTDVNGYIQAGWINSDSGNMGFGNRIARIQCSDDNYIRFQTLTEFKVSLGLSGRNEYSRRIDYSTDSRYHVGSFGHGGISSETAFHYGSGFFDVWSVPSGALPSGMSHIHGINMLHFTAGDGGEAYGWQLAGQYNKPGEYWARNNSGGTFSAWYQFITSANIGSQSVSYATTAGTANSVAWTNVSGRPTNVSSFTNDSGYLTSYSETDTLQSVTNRGATTTNGITIGGAITINKSGTNSDIVFPAQTNDPGFIRHYESNNAARMFFSVSDDDNSTDDYFQFGGGGLYRTTIYTNGRMDLTNVNLTGGGWFRNYGTTGLYNEDYGNHWYATNNQYWNIGANNASSAGIIIRTGGHQGTVRGYVYADNGNNIGFLTNGGSWSLRMDSSGNAYAGAFYDSGDTNYYLDPAGNSRLAYVRTSGIADPSYVRIVNPNGGAYVTQTSVITGAIQIKLPTRGSAMMMTCTVKVYDYSTNRSFTITLGGHRDSANWYNEFCYMEGAENRGTLNVRFGQVDDKDCMWIGETDTTWSYPQVFVTDVQLGYAGYDDRWLSDWNISFVTSFATVNRTQTAYQRITAGNIGSQSVSYATTAGTANSVAWTNVSGRPTNVSSFTNDSGYITSAGSISGNAATATTFSTGRTNYKGVTDNAVAGQLMWKNYGNNHTIFDASNSTSPSGGAVNNTNPDIGWSGTYPTLMGWNGSNTYGVRVDSARNADYASSAGSLSSMNISQFTNNSGYLTSETIGTGNTSGVAGAKYQINDTWLRVNSDNRQYQVYGNSRTIIWRTDGNTNDHGGGGYAYIWYYGGSADGNRRLILDTNGDVWSNTYGWFHDYFQRASSAINTSNIGSQSVNYASSAGSATNVVTIQDAAPGGSAGKLWWESDTGKLKVYYNSAWVDASPIPDMSLYYAKAGGAIEGDVVIEQTLTVVGNTLVQGTFTETSDISLKDNIIPITGALDKVLRLNGVYFNKKETPDLTELGFIAQEVEQVIPELVSEMEDGIKTVAYSRVAAVLVETIKEQQAQIEELKDLVAQLSKKLDNL